MNNFFGLFENENEKTQNEREDGKLRLHKEELDITKNKVDAGEVTLNKEVLEEQKTVNVPVTHEEVVIERKAINNELSNSPISDEETIHIPVSEEQVQVGKHTVTTEEVSAYKHDVEETKQIEETLKREEAHVDTTGHVNLVSDETASSTD
ncbi:YsnF/AvaK domain-containing protein [Priestia megaterium]|nr:YsnF/AvaK domain-containing protein [Priestia megaterium]